MPADAGYGISLHRVSATKGISHHIAIAPTKILTASNGLSKKAVEFG